jgi:predicted TIM-barrel fold metal-dependent hydrolase
VSDVVLPLPPLDDVEGERLPTQLPAVVDAHVHLFPDRVFEAVWRWFELHAWPIRHKLKSPDVLRFLFERGVSRVVALHYSHKPGMARALNAYVAELCRAEPRVIGLATVLPGEPEAERILAEAFAFGLHGVKLHCHVQRFAPDAPEMHAVCRACVEANKPLIIHAGRQPKSPAYGCDIDALCGAERIDRLLSDWPTLRLCVPHLGADEFDAYERLLEKHQHLWLDTTMAAADYLPGPDPTRLVRARPDRILYGTDFPNLPYAWDREVKRLAALGLAEHDLARLLGLNALALYG